MGFEVDSSLNSYTADSVPVASSNHAVWFCPANQSDSMGKADAPAKPVAQGSTTNHQETLYMRKWNDARVYISALKSFEWFTTMVQAFKQEVEWETKVFYAQEIKDARRKALKDLFDIAKAQNQAIKDQLHSAAAK